MMRTLSLLALAAACSHDTPTQAVCRDPAPTTQVGVTHGTIKIRDDAAVPPTTTIALDAARNEFEPFQIVVNGGTTGITDLQVTKAALVGSDGAMLPADHIRLYQEGRYFVKYASSAEGASGYWPDPLIPDVDAYANE